MKKYSLRTTEPWISEERIESHKDFDKLLASSQIIETRIRKLRRLKTLLGAVAVLLVAGLAYYYLQNPDSSSPKENQPTPLTHAIDNSHKVQEKQELQPPIPERKVEAPVKEEAVEQRKEKEGAKENEEENTPLKPSSHSNKQAFRKENENPGTAQAGEVISFQEASPTGGMRELYAYFSQELVYPEVDLLNETEGTVILTFSIATDGSAQEIQVVQSVSEDIDAEAVRLVQKMPAWVPALLNGKEIASRVNLPITFKITARHE